MKFPKLSLLTTLMWKNFLIQKRRRLGTTVEVMIPILFSAVMVVMRSYFETTNFNQSTLFKYVNIFNH